MKKFIKNFLKWFDIKPKIHNSKKRPFFQEREVWMCHWGTNIGFEMDGKKQELLRPVLVYKKLSGETLIAIPLTGNRKNGSWYINSVVKNKKGSFCMNQVKMIDAKRLKYTVEQISENTFKTLKKNVIEFLQ